MGKVTATALVESKEAIWNYDPREPENRIGSDGLDIIATIRTLAVKVSAIWPPRYAALIASLIVTYRCKCPANAWPLSRRTNGMSESTSRSSSSSTAIRAGAVRTRCANAHTSYVLYVADLPCLFLVLTPLT